MVCRIHQQAQVLTKVLNAMATDKDGSVLMLQHGMRRIVRPR